MVRGLRFLSIRGRGFASELIGTGPRNGGRSRARKRLSLLSLYLFNRTSGQGSRTISFCFSPTCRYLEFAFIRFCHCSFLPGLFCQPVLLGGTCSVSPGKLASTPFQLLLVVRDQSSHLPLDTDLSIYLCLVRRHPFSLGSRTLPTPRSASSSGHRRRRALVSDYQPYALCELAGRPAGT